MDVGQFLPTGHRGTAIITTRNPECRIHATVGSSEIDRMDREEAISLLLKASYFNEIDISARQRAQCVVDILGCLALGIVHTGAMVRQGLYSFEEYCDAYKSRRKELLNLQPAQGSSDYQYTVYTTWDISVNFIRNIATRSADDKASIIATNALDLLTLFGFCHFDGISEEIFQPISGNIRRRENNFRWWRTHQLAMFSTKPAQAWDPLPFRQATSLLCSYSLVLMTGNAISLHPLVHSWIRDSLDDSMRLQWWTISLSSLAMATDVNGLAFQLKPRLLPHVRSCLDTGNLEDFLVEDDSAYDRILVLYCNLLIYFFYLRQAESQSIVHQAVEYSIKCLGDDHDFTWLLLNLRLHMNNQLAQYEVTIDLFEGRANAVLDSPSLAAKTCELEALRQLAFAYKRSGRLRDSMTLLERLLSSHITEGGKKELLNLDINLELATIYFDIGRREEAVELCEAAHHQLQTVVNKDDLKFGNVEANLAGMYNRTGRSEEALEMYQGILPKHRLTFGEDHPNTLRTRMSIALTHGHLGQPDIGVPLAIEAMRLQKESGSSSEGMEWMQGELDALRAACTGG